MNAPNNNLNRVCEYVAISDVFDRHEILTRLIAFVLLDQNGTGLTVPEMRQAFRARYEHDEPEQVIDSEVHRLTKEEVLLEKPDGRYSLSLTYAAQLREQLADSQALEQRVRARWQEQTASAFGHVDGNLLWDCLTRFLCASFKEFGMQTVDLLIGKVATHKTFEQLLEQAASTFSTSSEKEVLKKAVGDFLERAPEDKERARYVTQLASGTYGFQTLEVPPDVAETFRRSHSEVVLYIDTNYLITLLGLEAAPQREAAQQLIQLIRSQKLHFKFRYLSETEKEMRRTLSAKKRELEGQTWSASVARSALTQANLGGVHAAYFEARATGFVAVDDFFFKFNDSQNMLKKQDVMVYQAVTDHVKEAAWAIEQELTEFLENGHRRAPGVKERKPDAIKHDALLLAWTRTQRSNAESPLEARALILTNDYRLARFDANQSRKNGGFPTAIVPAQLLQIIRPFIVDREAYNRAFAASFVMPEFRTLAHEGLSNQAYMKMLSVVNSIEGISDGDAERMLANRMLVKSVSETEDNEQAVELIRLEALQHAEISNKQLGEEREARKTAENEREYLKQQYEAAKSSNAATVEAQEARITKLEQAHGSTVSQLQSDLERAKADHQELKRWVTLLVISIPTSWLGWQKWGGLINQTDPWWPLWPIMFGVGWVCLVASVIWKHKREFLLGILFTAIATIAQIKLK